MEKLFNYSKLFHWFVMFSLILPFFYVGCNEEKIEEKPISISADSSLVDPNMAFMDTAVLQNEFRDTLQSTSLMGNKGAPKKQEKAVSHTLSQEFFFLRPILIPNQDTYTGLAILIDTFEYVSYIGVFLFWVFLILGLLSKYIEKNAFKLVILLEFFSVFFLAVSEPIAFQFHRLWGFWIALVLVLFLAIFDFLVYVKNSHRGELIK